MSDLADKLKAGKLSPSTFVGPIKALENLGCLASKTGKHLVLVLKRRALTQPEDLDDFETLAKLVGSLPRYFSESELETVREAYSYFAERYPDECDLRNPDELRDEATRIGNVGDLLQVDTDSAQTALKESADEIEKEEGSGWDDDDDRRGGGGDSGGCSDGELDSMFGTLGS